MTKAEGEYLGRVAALGCILCLRLGYGFTPAQIHHVREGEGAGQRASHFLGVPLCEPHHTGPRGIHGNRLALLPLKADEMDLLAWTIEELNS
ncbi:hypothetical protein LMG7141_00817 [Ralstonia condita]|uniref:DUF968 domain-containing protein n=1 Tax=Ralstonia condita TaxID=3058600 RepID=A0ABN9IFZ0_9RALS|nr:Ref family recombination enhancement nuclease [Ralstonia sp. LMG 7141]CAJ0778920.1 hypothetical protein LMG7141_00817 [Ralstonia sp. LMG 7141]